MLSAFFESLPGNPDWRAELAAAQDIDDISNVFRHVFSETMPPSNSPFFKDTFSSVTISIDQLVPREAADPERVKHAQEYMTAAKAGTGDKRAPVRVIDMGNGKFKVLDGNTTFQALKDLGETEVVVEIKKSLKQQVSNQGSIDDVYNQAATALPIFKDWVEAYGKKTGGKVMLRPGLKGKERAGEKVVNDYAGNASRLTDIIGGMILFDTVEQVAAAYQMISGDPAVFKAKNRFEKPTDDGYRDILMVVNIGGHLCELQLNTQAILAAKEQGLGHKLYEITRQLAPIAKDENNGDFAFMAMGYIDSFRKISVKLYRNAAMSSVISSASNMASDSEIDDEYKRILQQLSVSSISTHFPIDLPSIRKTQPVDFSIAKGTSSFSTNLKLSDSISNPPFDAENITRNGEKVNAKVITGRRTRSYLKDNDMLALQYAVVEAKSLVSSHNADFRLNPEFPAELQPRDRTRDLMKGQISYISNTLNPDRLGGSLYASVGSPIVGRDLVVESGNGRTMGIKQRYNKDGATEYKTWIIQNAGEFGLNPEKLAEIQQPVLVRIRLSDEDRKTITERANEADIASMSPMEQAKVDDSRLTAADMESFTPSKEGDIAAASNAGFIANFIEKVGKAEAAGLLTADSRPTKALVDRIQCAIFSKAYADDRLLTLMAEETHPAVKNILTALTAAAPVFAKIRASYPDMGGINLVDNIIEATRLMVQARDDGDGIEMILSQMGLFSQIPDETKTITRILNDNIRRSKHLGTVFKLAGERILTFLQNQNQVGLFGKEPPPTASEVITGAIARAAELDPANRQKGIFEDGDECEDDDEDEDDLVMEDNTYPDTKFNPLDLIMNSETPPPAPKVVEKTVSAKQEVILKLNDIRASISKEIADRTAKDVTIPNNSRIDWNERQEIKRNRNAIKYEQVALNDVNDAVKRIEADEDIKKVLSDYRLFLDNYIAKYKDWHAGVLERIKEEEQSKQLSVSTAKSSAPSGAITEQWRFDIREAKTFQDIADVFNREFGVTVDGDPVLEAAKKTTFLERNAVFLEQTEAAVKTHTDTRASSVTNKQPWEMTRDEYRFQENFKKLQAILTAIKQGITLSARTSTQTLLLRNPEYLKIASNGDIWTYRGDTKWVYIDDGMVNLMASEAGMVIPNLFERVEHNHFIEQALSDGLPVPDAVLKEYRNSPGIKWRLDIREAKTFQDIADVFENEFGVYLEDDPVLEAAQVRTPATVEENIQRGTEAMNRVISKHVNEPRAMYRQDLGWIAFYWGKPGRNPPSFSNKDDMLEWWNSLKNKFGLFEGGYGVSHIIAKRNWEGKYIKEFIGQNGEAVALKLVDVIAKGNKTTSKTVNPSRIIIRHGIFDAVLDLKHYQKDQVWLVSGMELAGEYKMIFESSGESGFCMAQTYANQNTDYSRDLGAEDGQNLYHQDDDVNKIFESVTDTIAPSVTAVKQPWEMTKDEYNEDYQDSPLQQNLIDKWANDSKTIKRKDRESFRASWWEKNDPHTQAIEQAMSEGLPVPDAVLNDYRNSPKIKWRIGIRKAKTFQDIADVFSDVFGVTVDDPA